MEMYSYVYVECVGVNPCLCVSDLPSLPRAVKATGAKSRHSTQLGKAVKKPATQSGRCV